MATEKQLATEKDGFIWTFETSNQRAGRCLTHGVGIALYYSNSKNGGKGSINIVIGNSVMDRVIMRPGDPVVFGVNRTSNRAAIMLAEQDTAPGVVHFRKKTGKSGQSEIQLTLRKEWGFKSSGISRGVEECNIVKAVRGYLEFELPDSYRSL